MDFLFTCFEQYRGAQQLLALENPLPLPAYERILKAAHSFNLLDARKAISVTERQRYILRIRTLDQSSGRSILPLTVKPSASRCATKISKRRLCLRKLFWSVEIGTEELPPKALRSLAESFAANFTAELDNAGLAHGTVQSFLLRVVWR